MDHMIWIASKYMARDRAEELVRNIVAALLDGVEDSRTVVMAAIVHRRQHFGLDLGDEAAEQLTDRLTDAYDFEAASTHIRRKA